MTDENPNFELVDLEDFIPGIKLDIRYATENNFTGQKVYESAKAYARWPVAKALLIIDKYQCLFRHQISSLKWVITILIGFGAAWPRPQIDASTIAVESSVSRV